MRKVLPGQTLSIPATTFNTMIDAARDYQGRTLNQRAGRMPRDTKFGTIMVRNQTAHDCSVFDVLGFDTPCVLPDENLDEFYFRFAFNGVDVAEEHAQRFCVLQEPVVAGAFGRALIVGVTPVWLWRDTGESAEYAGIDPGYGTLLCGVEGAQILWEDETTGIERRPALVRLPYGGGGALEGACLSAKAAATAKTTAPDGQTITVGDRLLVLSGADAGVWKYNADGTWADLGIPEVVGVQLGDANGLTMFYLNAGGTAYDRNVSAAPEVTIASVKAAGASKTSPLDGQTISTGALILVVSGTDVGVWKRTSTAWDFVGKPAAVAVQLGATYGLLTMFFNATSTAYVKGQAVFA